MSSLPILLAESVQNADEILRRGESVTQEPTADDGSRPSNAAPAVNVRGSRELPAIGRSHRESRPFRLTKGTERSSMGWRQQTASRAGFADQAVVGDKRLPGVVRLVLLHQVDEHPDASGQQRIDLCVVFFRVGIAGICSRKKKVRHDPVAR